MRPDTHLCDQQWQARALCPGHTPRPSLHLGVRESRSARVGRLPRGRGGRGPMIAQVGSCSPVRAVIEPLADGGERLRAKGAINPQPPDPKSVLTAIVTGHFSTPLARCQPARQAQIEGSGPTHSRLSGPKPDLLYSVLPRCNNAEHGTHRKRRDAEYRVYRRLPVESTIRCQQVHPRGRVCRVSTHHDPTCRMTSRSFGGWR
jgi:hypothetical protein